MKIIDEMSKEKVGERSKEEALVAIGTRVCLTGYSPFRGLIGTVQTIDAFWVENDQYEFYEIEIEGVQGKELLLWFERDEFMVYP